MYRHLLVPLDGSMLATELIRQSVLLAKSLAAKVTFFHVQEDFGAASVASLNRVMWPTLHSEGLAEETHALLAKAEVVAREAGVEHSILTITSDRPHAAILQAAEQNACDLIVIASHGRRGLKRLMQGSQTERVLQQTRIPVLVLPVEGSQPGQEQLAPLAILRDEHRSIAAVLHGLELLVREAREQGQPPRFDLLRAIARYIRDFPDALHHTKEDAYLFRKLRERTSEFNETLDELQRQHATGSAQLDEFERSIDRYQADPKNGFDEFSAFSERFVSEQMQHLRLETQLIFPAASRHLTAEDWNEIGQAFASNGDPRFSADTDEEYRQLFVRILSLMPKTGGTTPSIT